MADLTTTQRQLLVATLKTIAADASIAAHAANSDDPHTAGRLFEGYLQEIEIGLGAIRKLVPKPPPSSTRPEEA
jgi:hypothetical protein